MAKQKTTHRLAENLTISERNHTNLLEYLTDRLRSGKICRDAQIPRYTQIDRDVAGFIKLSSDDKVRMEKNRKGRGPHTTAMSLQLTDSQIKEIVTYILDVTASEGGLYKATSGVEKQELGNSFTSLMNRHASLFNHYGVYSRSIHDMLKYNLGGWRTDWVEVYGNKLGSDATGGVEIKHEIVKTGNELKALDMYNFLYDSSVDPTMLHSHGEYFGEVEAISAFKAHKMEEDGLIFDFDKLLGGDTNREYKYYETRPSIVSDLSGGEGDDTDWAAIVGGHTGKTMGAGLEMINMWIWIRPSDFGLSKEKKYEIWRFTIMGNRYIVGAGKESNAHAELPVSLGMPIHDGFKLQTGSVAESLIPLQRFASHELNIHQDALRKALYGLLFYDKRKISLDELDDIVAGQIPVSNLDSAGDIRKAVYQLNDAPRSDNTMQNVSNAVDIMQTLHPSNITKQVTDLERATQYQAAKAVQSGNAKNYTMARLIDGQALAPCRRQQMYNIFQYQETMEFIDEQGKTQEITPSEFRDSNIEFAVSDGLKGLDRLWLTTLVKETIYMVVQNPEVAAKFDVAKMLDYLLDLAGDTMDFKQFAYDDPFDALPPEQKQMAMQLLQQAMASQEAPA